MGAGAGEFLAEVLASGKAPNTGEAVADCAPFRLERIVVSMWPSKNGKSLPCMDANQLTSS